MNILKVVGILTTLFFISYKANGQTPVIVSTDPLRYADTVVTEFCMGLENSPTILPSKNVIFNIILLGEGMYHSKYLGKTPDGSNLYDRPQKLPDWSKKITFSKLFHLAKKSSELFLFDSEEKKWFHYDFEESPALKISNPRVLIAGGKPVVGEFTIMRIGQKNILIKMFKSPKSGYYIPNNRSLFGYPPNPDAGFNKGYDEKGKWMGEKSIFYISYAEQIEGKDWEFGGWKRIKMNDEDFTLTTFSNQIHFQQVDLLRNNSPQLLISHDVDELSLYSLNYQSDKLEFLSLKLPKGIKKTTDEVYFSMPFTSTIPYGEKNSGFVIGGNPGILIEYFWHNKNKAWSHRPLMMRGGDLNVRTLAVPNWIDWDGDGIADIVSGDSSGFLWFFKNTGTAENPVWKPGVKLSAANRTIHHQAGLTGSIQGPNEKRWGYTQPLVTDWDGDGLLDIVCNDITGYYVVYKNIGKVGQPTLSSAVPLMLDQKQFKAAWRSKPAFLPLEFLKLTGVKDQLDPLLAINGKGLLCMYTRNKRSPNTLIEERELLNVKNEPVRIVGFAGNEGRATLGICDINQDGVWDIIFGQGNHMHLSRQVPQALTYASAYVMVNKGSNEHPRFAAPSPLCDNQGISINMDRHGCWISPIMDSNYKIIDLLVGGEDGRFYIYKKPIVCASK